MKSSSQTIEAQIIYCYLFVMPLDPQAYMVLQLCPSLLFLVVCTPDPWAVCYSVLSPFLHIWRNDAEIMHFDDMLCLLREVVEKCSVSVSAQITLRWSPLDQRHKVGGCCAFHPTRETSIIGNQMLANRTILLGLLITIKSIC